MTLEHIIELNYIYKKGKYFISSLKVSSDILFIIIGKKVLKPPILANTIFPGRLKKSSVSSRDFTGLLYLFKEFSSK